MSQIDTTLNFINSLVDLKTKSIMPEDVRIAFLNLMPQSHGPQVLGAIVKYEKDNPGDIYANKGIANELLGGGLGDKLILLCGYTVWPIHNLVIYKITDIAQGNEMERLLDIFIDLLLYIYTNEVDYWKKFIKFVVRDREGYTNKLSKLWRLFLDYPSIPEDLVNVITVTAKTGELFVSGSKHFNLSPLLAYVSFVYMSGKKASSIDPSIVWRLFLSDSNDSFEFDYLKVQQIIAAIDNLAMVFSSSHKG